MKTDKAIIRKLIKEIDYNLQEIDSASLRTHRGYSFSNGKVIGINISGFKLRSVPQSVTSFESLEILHMDGNDLDDLTGLEELYNLIVLDVDGNHIEDLSPIKSLIKLNELSLRENNIADLKELSQLKNLEKLFLSNNAIKNWDGLEALHNLNELDLWDTGLLNLTVISRLPNIKKLDISENKLVDISLIGKLTRLEALAIAESDLINIEALSDLVNLIELDLSNNQISDLSPLKFLVALRELSLIENKITDIKPIGNLLDIKILNLSNNFISDISPLADYVAIESLHLGYNKITDLDSLSKLTTLNDLDIWQNQLETIDGLTNLADLVSLDISHNLIYDISILSQLTKLVTIEAASNLIRNIPLLNNLTSLRELNLRSNFIQDLNSLKFVRQLNRLDLSFNEICVIPQWLIDGPMDNCYSSNEYLLSYENGFNLYGNPIENVPVELFYLGKNAIRDYLKSLEDGAEPINEIKVILLGEGAAGKTSLMKYLQGKPYEKNQPQTHGINLEACTQETGITMKVWDFGGQDIMHHTHQFFLTRKSIYILVLNARENTDTEKWLKLIQVFGGDSPVIIVTNKIDENPSDHENIKYLNTKYPNLQNRYVRISCEKNIGLDAFTDILTETIGKLLQVRTLWGKSWLGVKRELEEMRNGESLKDYIHFDRYEELCLKHNVPESHRETLINWLHQLGVVTYFPDSNLSETNVINPSWLTEAFYSIINSEVVARDYGRFNINNLKDILDNQRYPKQKYQFLLSLMMKFELCYQIDTSNYLIPDLLNKEEPNFDFSIKSALKLKYKYSNLLPKAILPKFMVRRHQQILNEKKWRTGILISDPYFESQGLIRLDEADKEISIYVTGEEKRGYLASIISDLENINVLYEGLDYNKLIPCCCAVCEVNEKPFYFKYEVLLNLKQRKKTTHICEVSLNDVNINELLGTLITREELENEITDLVGRGTFQTRKYLVEGNVLGFINTIKSLFSSVSYLLFEKSEKAYHTPLFLLLRSIFLSNARADEIQTKGRADIIIVLDKQLYVLELKLDGTVDEAMDQIHLNKYYEPYLLEQKKIILIAINFSSKDRNIENFDVQYLSNQ